MVLSPAIWISTFFIAAAAPINAGTTLAATLLAPAITSAFFPSLPASLLRSTKPPAQWPTLPLKTTTSLGMFMNYETDEDFDTIIFEQVKIFSKGDTLTRGEELSMFED
jgi:hypothetical protein